MGFRYQTLAGQLIRDIKEGRLQAGQRVPSIRSQSQLHGVSITTVKKCYEFLEAQGYLLAKAQSGFYVRNLFATLPIPKFKSLEPSSRTIENADLLDEIQQSANNAHRLPLGTIQLATDLLPAKALQRSLLRSVRQKANNTLAYRPVDGQPSLKSALCSHFAGYGLSLSPSDLLINYQWMHGRPDLGNQCR